MRLRHVVLYRIIGRGIFSKPLSRTKPLLSVYVSGHGYGHSTRTATFLERLLRVVDCELDVCSTVPPSTWPAAVSCRVRFWRELPSDVGVLQSDELSVDLAGTADALLEWQRDYARRVAEETRRLAAGSAAVLGDVPPLAFDAAAEAGVPSFALANFSWDWIYARMGLTEAAAEARRAYRRAGLLLELTPAAPMPVFRSKLSLGVLGRSRDAKRHHTRAALGLAPRERLVLVAFRSSASYALPPATADVRYACCDGSRPARSDCAEATAECCFLDLLAAADVAVAKAGYGIIADAWAAGTPLLYTTRTGFPEDGVLTAWLERQPWARQVTRERLRAGEWLGDAEDLLCRKRPRPGRSDAVEPGVAAIRTALAS